ncbi:hypothetical protein [Schumannella soli]|uniref:Glutaminase n=1 Tax=Schumannella soli TaxID=2590779 RepID=A0A506Y1H7_9MICO|nr:hypothetical protein [Schumannella soli]TPW75812.1 hypothetical protein FJ657_08090 [Schumannella soli]
MDDSVSTAISDARAALALAVERLAAAGARTELRAEIVEPRRVLGVRRAPQLQERGRVWRLGALLLDEHGGLFATGASVRAADPKHSALQSSVAHDRREVKVLARAAGIPDGETVDLDALPLHLDELAPGAAQGPLVLADDGVRVVWAPGAAAVPLAAYLEERVELLAHPPRGSVD